MPVSFDEGRGHWWRRASSSVVSLGIGDSERVRHACESQFLNPGSLHVTRASSGAGWGGVGQLPLIHIEC